MSRAYRGRELAETDKRIAALETELANLRKLRESLVEAPDQAKKQQASLDQAEASRDRESEIASAVERIREWLAAGNTGLTAGVAAALQIPVSVARLAIQRLGRKVERGADEQWRLARPSSGPRPAAPYALPMKPATAAAPVPAIDAKQAALVRDYVRTCQRSGNPKTAAQIAADLKLSAQTVRLICAADGRLFFEGRGVVAYRESKGGAA